MDSVKQRKRKKAKGEQVGNNQKRKGECGWNNEKRAGKGPRRWGRLGQAGSDE